MAKALTWLGTDSSITQKSWPILHPCQHQHHRDLHMILHGTPKARGKARTRAPVRAPFRCPMVAQYLPMTRSLFASYTMLDHAMPRSNRGKGANEGPTYAGKRHAGRHIPGQSAPSDQRRSCIQFHTHRIRQPQNVR